MNWLNETELPILWWIREHLTNPFLDTVMPYISSLARHGEFWILLALILPITAYYTMWATGAALFALAVYYTTKLM